ncbi:hypothetical protein D3C78_18240 [compost metagenome]
MVVAFFFVNYSQKRTHHGMSWWARELGFGVGKSIIPYLQSEVKWKFLENAWIRILTNNTYFVYNRSIKFN